MLKQCTISKYFAELLNMNTESVKVCICGSTAGDIANKSRGSTESDSIQPDGVTQEETSSPNLRLNCSGVLSNFLSVLVCL